jgi:hypothetical protein
LASEIRITARDQRAVVMRWTAESTTPAEQITVKKSQFTCHACHARSWPVAAPTMKDDDPENRQQQRHLFQARRHRLRDHCGEFLPRREVHFVMTH